MRSAWLIVAFGALGSACTTDDVPCVGDDPGLRVIVHLPCCDAHNAQVDVMYSDDLRPYYHVDTSNVIAGGTVELVTAYPGAVPEGEASVWFYADGDGVEFFEAMAILHIDPSRCSEVELTAVATVYGS